MVYSVVKPFFRKIKTDTGIKFDIELYYIKVNFIGEVVGA